MKKSTKRSGDLVSEVKFADLPIPPNDMTEFQEQIHYRMSSQSDHVDDTNPENWLHKISIGMEVGI